MGHPLRSNKSNFWALYPLVRSWIKEWKDDFTKTTDKRFWSDPSTPFANTSLTCVRTLCMACRLTFIKLIYFRRVTLTFIMLAVWVKKQHIIRMFWFPLLHFQGKLFLIQFSQTIFYGGMIHMSSNVTSFRIKSSVCYC